MGLEDIAMFRPIPNSVVLYPSDAVSTERLVSEAAKRHGICYIRTTRPKTALLYSNEELFPIGGSKTLRKSANDRVTVVGAGITVHEALKAADALAKEGIAIRVIDAYSVKPIDRDGLLAAAGDTGGRMIVVEDHYEEGVERGWESGQRCKTGGARDSAVRTSGGAARQIRNQQ
jgi:transketolase